MFMPLQRNYYFVVIFGRNKIQVIVCEGTEGVITYLILTKTDGETFKH